MVKLENDVASINAAIRSYVTGGGDLSHEGTAAEVIDALKWKASDQEIIAGYRGSFVDPRLRLVMQTDAEAAESNWRAHSENANKAFTVSKSRAVGIK